MPNMNYAPGGSGGYAPPQLSYGDPRNQALGYLDQYNTNANQTSDWLSKVLASNQAASQSAANASNQQYQNQQDTAAAAAGPGGAMQGAAAGASFGPWGAGIGAIIGGGLGSAKDYAYRTQKDPWYKAAGQTFLDAINPVNSFNALTGMAGGQSQTGGNLAKGLGSLSKPGPAATQTGNSQVPGLTPPPGQLNYSLGKPPSNPSFSGTPSLTPPDTGSYGPAASPGSSPGGFNLTPPDAAVNAQRMRGYMDENGIWHPPTGQ